MPGASSRSSGINLLTDLANASFWFGFISAHERGGTGWFEGFRLHTELVPILLFSPSLFCWEMVRGREEE